MDWQLMSGAFLPKIVSIVLRNNYNCLRLQITYPNPLFGCWLNLSLKVKRSLCDEQSLVEMAYQFIRFSGMFTMPFYLNGLECALAFHQNCTLPQLSQYSDKSVSIICFNLHHSANHYWSFNDKGKRLIWLISHICTLWNPVHYIIKHCQNSNCFSIDINRTTMCFNLCYVCLLTFSRPW